MKNKKRIYKVGDVIEGTVTGIQPYGVFVGLDDHTQGLIHISECQHGYVDDLSDFAKVNDKIKVKIIDIDEYDQKISLSVRALYSLNNPPFPAKLKRIRRRRTPNIGFQSIEKKMPIWIKDAFNMIEQDTQNSIK